MVAGLRTFCSSREPQGVAVVTGDLLQDGEAARVGDGAGDGLHLVVRKMFSRFRHG